MKFLSDEWRSYVEGNSSIESVLTAYDRLGFDANQDLPGNVLWEEMYRASAEFKNNFLIKVGLNDPLMNFESQKEQK